jgi:hypothetical protein
VGVPGLCALLRRVPGEPGASPRGRDFPPGYPAIQLTPMSRESGESAPVAIRKAGP